MARVIAGSDHAGYGLKGQLLDRLELAGVDFEDVGSYGPEEVDFPDIAALVGELVRSDSGARGLLVCGTGVGASIAANKIDGVRAVLAHDTFSAHQGVEHDDANVLCVGGWIIGIELAWEVVQSFLAARWSGGETLERRVAKIAALEKRQGHGV